MQVYLVAALLALASASPVALPEESNPSSGDATTPTPAIPFYIATEAGNSDIAVKTGFLAWKQEQLRQSGVKADPNFSLENFQIIDIPNDEDRPDIAERDTIEVYGQGQNVPVNAPGVPFKPAYRGFPSRGTGPPQTNIFEAAAYTAFRPGFVPQGVNPPQCTPKPGQYPVILIPGTLANAYDDWAALGPKLADEGLCVYTFNHNPLTLLFSLITLEIFPFTGDIPASAMALDKVVDQVLEMTGAEKVDFVGHSQGAGALPFYYLKNLMKGSKVRKTIGIAPSLGTTAGGLDALFNIFGRKIWEFDINSLVLGHGFNSAAFDEQLVGSDFMKALNDGGPTIEGVEYVNIATIHDDVLIPWSNCLPTPQEGRNITNIILQNICAEDRSDHPPLTYSRNVHQIVMNHIFDTDNPITCYPEKPLLEL